MLFKVAFASIIKEIQQSVKAVVFANDLAILTCCNSITEEQTKLQQIVQKINSWTTENGLDFSPNKCAGMHFCKHKKYARQLIITLNNNMIPLPNTIKYLRLKNVMETPHWRN